MSIDTPFFDHSHDETHLNFNQITECIYIGNNQCCHVGLDVLLQKENIYADVSMEENVVDNPVGVQSFLWIPVIDHCPPDIEQMNLGIAFIDTVVTMNKKVYVHCKNGHGRAPTLVMAYLIKKQHMNFESAYALVKQKRSVIHLDETQEKFLRELV